MSEYFNFTTDEEALIHGYRSGQNSLTQDKAMHMLRVMVEAAADIERDVEDPEQGSKAEDRLAHLRDTIQWCRGFLNKK